MSIISGRTSAMESEYDPADNTWDDWQEEEEPMTCLLCSDIYQSASAVFAHCAQVHGFDFVKLRKEKKWDFYQCVRMINYIRSRARDNAELAQATEFSLSEDEVTTFMQDDTYLTPVMEEDALLYAFENLDLDDRMSMRSGFTAGSRMRYQLSEGNILDRLHAVEAKLASREHELNTVQRQFEEYRTMVKQQFYDVFDDKTSVRSSVHPGAADINADSGDYYFNSYAHIEIHDQMLKDRVRTEAYRDFMYDNKHFFDGKIVLDVGCGTGILSMFAAKSGAARVFAVDNSNIIEQAKKIAKENGLDDRITFIRGKVEEIKLPVPTVDIIISEWMGYFLLFEAMLDSVLVARDKFLAPDGILAPNRSSIHLIGIEDEGLMNDKIDFWSDVYGFKMQTVQRTVYNEAIVDTVNAETRITDSCCLQSFDHNVVAAAQLDFKTKFTLRASKDATLHAFLGYFDIDFETTADDTDARPVMFTTGPHGIETHWKQTIFVLKESLSVKEGDIITGVFTCQKSTENQRELDLDISYWKVDENGTALTESRSQSFQLR